MYCTACGHALERDDRPCLHCGYDRTLETAAAELRRTLSEGLTLLQSALAQLDRQTEALQAILKERRTRPPQPAVTEAGPTAEPIRPTETSRSPFDPPLPSPPSRPAPLRRGEREVHLGQKWMLATGVAVVLLGIAYFLKWSFERNLIPPAARVAMAYLAGLSAMGVGGAARKRGYDRFGDYLIGGGIAALYAATAAGFQLYRLMPQGLAFGLMILITATAGLAAARFDSIGLALLGLAGGFATPLALSTGTSRQVPLMTYLLILNGGVLGLSAVRHWRWLNHLGWCFTWLLFLGWALDDYTKDKFAVTMIFLHAFFLIYTLVPFAGHILGRIERSPAAGFSITLPNALVTFAFAYVFISDRYSTAAVSAATAGYAALFLGLAARLHRSRGRESLDSTVLLLAKGMAFLAVSVPLLFEAYLITDLWMALGVALYWASLRLGHRGLGRAAAALAVLAALKLYFVDYPDHWNHDPFTLAWFHRALTNALVLGGLWTLHRWTVRAGEAGPLPPAWRPLWPVGLSVGLLASLHLETGKGFAEYAPSARFAAISVLWALYSIALMLLGFARNRSGLRQAATLLFGLTLGKIFLFDMANTSTPFRIVSFIVVGLLLIGASWLYYRFKDRILPDEGRPQ